MKKYTLYLLLITLCFLWHTNNAQTPNLFPGIEKEHQMDFSTREFFPSRESAKKKVKRFLDRVRSRSNFSDTIKLSRLPIAVSHFEMLYAKAKAACEDDNDNSPCLTGFIMHFGLNSGNRMQLVFQPWILDLKALESGKLKAAIDVVDDGTFYQYSDSEGFKPLSSQEIRNYQRSRVKFRRGIAVRRENRDVSQGGRRNFRNFRTRRNWKGDSRSAFFTFQLIAELDRRARLDPSTGYLGNIYVVEGMSFKKKQAWGSDLSENERRRRRNRNKMTSLLLTQGLYKEILEENGIAADNLKRGIREDNTSVANLSGICPPGCVSFQLDLLNTAANTQSDKVK